MISAIVYLVFINFLSYALPSSVHREDYGEVKLFQSPASYDVDNTVLLNEVSRLDKEVSYNVKAVLNVLPVWAEQSEVLLKFELISPQLYARGKDVNSEYTPLKSVWDFNPYSTFFAHWDKGHVRSAYLDSSDLIDIQNFKRSLISVFQFRMFDGEGNETDVSGLCDVHYETLSTTTFRKTKRECAAAGWAQGADHEVRSRRLARYSLDAAGASLRELHAEELHELGEAAAGGGLKARAWLRLRSRAPPPPASPGSSLADALAALPAALREASLAAPPPTPLPDEAHLELSDEPPAEPHEPPTDEALLEAAAEAWGGAADEGGTLREARAALRALAGARSASPLRLGALLHDGAHADRLTGLCAALGLVGAGATHAAAARFLRLRQRDAPPHLAHTYFAALALAAHPQDAVVEDTLKLAAELSDARLAESALLAAAAAAPRASPRASRGARDAIADGLAACRDDECRRVRLTALGNLRRADTADLLLRHAESGAGAAFGALDALEAAGALPAAALPRLEALALGRAALEKRALALDVLLRASASAPFGLPRVLLALREEGARELSRLAWRRLEALAQDSEPVRLLLRMLPRPLRGWDVRALGGTSAVLVREAGSGAGPLAGWRAELASHTVARGGLLRRAAVALQLRSPRNASDLALAVHVWTRGLDALVGASDADEESAGGGLTLAVGGAEMPAVTLFDGQAELLGHVWAGTGSEPTPVLRALRPLGEARASVPLLGGAALHYARSALAAAALDAHAVLSLWARTARAHLALRGAASARSGAAVRTAWGALAATARSELEAQLHIAADLDFYDGMVLCVRAHTEPHRHSSAVALQSALGEARRRVRRARSAAWAREGRTLALGPPNDTVCHALTAHA